jgi:hypothetical protein
MRQTSVQIAARDGRTATQTLRATVAFCVQTGAARRSGLAVADTQRCGGRHGNGTFGEAWFA